VRSFTLLQTPPGSLDSSPADLCILPHPEPNKLTLITSSPLESYDVSPISFFNVRPEGIKLIARAGRTSQDNEAWESALSKPSSSPISRFVRTAEGRCIGVVREEGTELLLVTERGSHLILKERFAAATNLVVLDKGKGFGWGDVLLLTVSTYR
jgi:hypothetical protein